MEEQLKKLTEELKNSEKKHGGMTSKLKAENAKLKSEINQLHK